MSDPPGAVSASLPGPRRLFVVNGFTLAFAALAVASLLMGYIGFYQHLSVDPDGRMLRADVWHYALQLFVLESPPPLEGGGPFPPLLEIARFTAPAVTFYALIEACRYVFATQVRRRQTRRAHGHVVVCGDGLLASSLTRRLLAAGSRVVQISPRHAEWLGVPANPMRIVGDARDPEVLRAAGVRRAVALYACTDDSATNTAIALTAGQPAGGAGPAAVYAHVADPELCLALQARHLGTEPSSALRLDFFNVDDLAARRMCAARPLRPLPDRPPHVLILGATAFGRAVIVEVARQWWVQDRADTTRLHLTVVDPAATLVLEELSYRYPFLAKACDLVGRTGEVDLADDGDEPEPPDRVFICYDDEQLALKTALSAERLWRGGAGSVVVRQEQLATMRTAVDRASGQQLFDQVSDTLRVFGVIATASDPGLIRDDLGERLARVIHESYLVARRQRGETDPAMSSLVPWTDLPDWQKRENRAQAADIGRKLRSIGCVLAPRIGHGDEYHFGAEEIERLAVMEHERWMATRWQAGWQHAAVRDDDHRRHPAMVPWEDLPEYLRERDRDPIRQLPGILADCGFRIVRR